MSKFALVIVMMLVAGRNSAQNYPAPNNETPTFFFVLIQSDDAQPFYVRLDNRLYSSTPAGHLILSQLKDSVYAITIGFPGHTFAEQRYLLNIESKDRALYLIRQANQWTLSDAHDQALPTIADSLAATRPLLVGAKKDDAFSRMMSAIVQDTAVMYNTYAVASPDSTLSANHATFDSVSSSQATPRVILAPKTDTIAKVPGSSHGTIPASSGVATPTLGAVPSAPTGVVKLSEHKSAKSLSLVYADHPSDAQTDTIDVVIPVDPEKKAAFKPDTTQSSIPAATRILKPDTSTATSPHATVLPFVNSDCHAFATAYDVDKLRVRMLAVPKDEDRIQAAYKIFKTKCFATKQIRALSEVFPNDATKFKFLATAYPFVSDDEFPGLIDLLSDPGYVAKFKTMTGGH